MSRDYHNPAESKQQYGRGAIYAEQRDRDKEDAARKRAGLLKHIDDPTDPWATVTWRTCEPPCTQHKDVTP